METNCIHRDECRSVDMDSGRVRRTVMARGGNLMMVEFSFSEGGTGALHSHPHEQLSYCLSGEFLYTLGEATERFVPGDSMFIPAGATHGVRCLSAGSLLDVFSPQREDFIS